MALFTIPALSKGTPGTVTLDKSALLALAPIAADEYFSDGDNVQYVVVEWNSNPGSQREIAKFKFSDATPSHDFLVSAQAQDVFEVEQLILIDFDNGEMRLDRAELDAAIAGGVAQFDIDFAAGGGGGSVSQENLESGVGYFAGMPISNLTRVSAGTGVTTATNSTSLHLFAYHLQSGSFTEPQVSEFVSTGLISGISASQIVVSAAGWNEIPSPGGYAGVMLGAKLGEIRRFTWPAYNTDCLIKLVSFN